MSLKITFIADEDYKELIPEPQPASSAFPEWFSSMKMHSKSKCPFSFLHKNNPYELGSGLLSEDANVKNCPGITDFLNTGYIIPAWDNFMFREDENKDLYVNWSTTYANRLDVHNLNQFPTMGVDQRPMYDRFFKLNTPWIIKTDPGVSCLILHPYWHRKTSFTNVSGVYNTDALELSLKWFFEWNYQIESGLDLDNANHDKQTICKGDPIMLIVPFYRKTFEKKVKYVSDKEYNRLFRKTAGTLQPFKNNDPYRLFRRTLPRFFK